MSNVAIAKRYAKALFDLSTEQRCVETVDDDLFLINEVLLNSSEILLWFQHPNTELKHKKDLIMQQFPRINEFTRNLLFLLIDRKREDEIPTILYYFKELSLHSRGIVAATVTSARSLSNEEREQLNSIFQEITAKQVQFVEKVDSDLLAGVVVQIGDRVYDGSLKTKLAGFKRRLNSIAVG